MLPRVRTPPGRLQALTDALEAFMATPAEVASLRTMVDDVAAPQMFDNTTLESFIDAHPGNLQAAAADVWVTKAGKYAGLVDVTEGSSSRKLSQLQANALKMSEFYGASPAAENPTTSGRSGTRPIVRA